MRLVPLLLAALLAAVGTRAGTAANDSGGDDWSDDWATTGERGSPVARPPWRGFVEAAGGRRLDADPAAGRRGTLGDLRLRAENDWQGQRASFALKADGLWDAIDRDFDLVVRELGVTTSPGARIDLKAGRQVLTWGTGDLLFLNDFFPKDFVSFFAGRDDEYLKAPSDTLRVTFYSDALNLDIAWTPRFTPDEYLTGERFSFYSRDAGMRVAPEPPLGARLPARDPANGEFALRLFTTRRGVEYALYGYRGFFKQPSDFRDPARPGYAPLSALGASLRRPLAGGLWNAEGAYHFSRHDRRGDDPALPNDQLRLLTGYEREWLARFTVGLQYYVEWTGDHGRLRATSPHPELEGRARRHLATTRLTWRTPRDTLTASLFAFWSPSDHDLHLRPALTWRYSDIWNLSAGANLFHGRHPQTFFGQLEDNANAWVRVRRNY